MDSTRNQRVARARNAGYLKSTERNYSSRNRVKESEENNYKKAIFMLQIMICIGLFTGALLIRTINTSFTDDIRERIKTAISQNIPIDELYNKAADKIEDLPVLKSNTEQSTIQDNEAKKNLEVPTEKLVPTLE